MSLFIQFILLEWFQTSLIIQYYILKFWKQETRSKVCYLIKSFKEFEKLKIPSGLRDEPHEHVIKVCMLTCTSEQHTPLGGCRPLTTAKTPQTHDRAEKSARLVSLHSRALTRAHGDITQHYNSSHRAAGKADGEKGKEEKAICLKCCNTLAWTAWCSPIQHWQGPFSCRMSNFTFEMFYSYFQSSI